MRTRPPRTRGRDARRPPNTRRTYATALRQLRAWFDDRPLDDASLAAYVGHLHEAGRAPATVF